MSLYQTILFAFSIVTLNVCHADSSIIDIGPEDVQITREKRLLVIPLESGMGPYNGPDGPQPEAVVEAPQPEPTQVPEQLQPQEQPIQQPVAESKPISQQESGLAQTKQTAQVQPAQTQVAPSPPPPPPPPPPPSPAIQPLWWPSKMKYFFHPMNPLFANGINSPYAQQSGQAGHAGQTGQPGQPGQPGQQQRKMFVLWRWKG